jgi:hypothetical protein
MVLQAHHRAGVRLEQLSLAEVSSQNFHRTVSRLGRYEQLAHIRLSGRGDEASAQRVGRISVSRIEADQLYRFLDDSRHTFPVHGKVQMLPVEARKKRTGSLATSVQPLPESQDGAGVLMFAGRDADQSTLAGLILFLLANVDYQAAVSEFQIIGNQRGDVRTSQGRRETQQHDGAVPDRDPRLGSREKCSDSAELLDLQGSHLARLLGALALRAPQQISNVLSHRVRMAGGSMVMNDGAVSSSGRSYFVARGKERRQVERQGFGGRRKCGAVPLITPGSEHCPIVAIANFSGSGEPALLELSALFLKLNGFRICLKKVHLHRECTLSVGKGTVQDSKLIVIEFAMPHFGRPPPDLSISSVSRNFRRERATEA